MSEITNTNGNIAAEAQASAVDDAMKVFAGNLAFATTEEELRSVFTEAGEVQQAQIIKRGTRSLGYGFVTYQTEAEAKKAIQLLNKKEIAGREINVESAKPQSDLVKHNDSGNYTLEDGEEAGEGKGAAIRGGRGRGKARGKSARGRGAATSRRPRADDGEEELEDPVKENGEDGTAAASTTNGGLTKSARRRQKKAAAKQAEGSGEAAADAPPTTESAAAPTEKKVKAPREPRKPKGAPKGEPSKTLLFVANLPFQFSDEELKAAFEGFQVKTAKVVKRRFGTRTKGFGFVDLENEEEQLRALKEVHGKQVEGRDLQLKIAIQEEDRKEGEEVDANVEAEPTLAQ
ncbi:hypothetical protein CBS101457_001822 [Exobasidium rhododendri]|nr:hypothetical protein CBS101457_001822 [Exobasidium rhododendri]